MYSPDAEIHKELDGVSSASTRSVPSSAMPREASEPAIAEEEEEEMATKKRAQDSGQDQDPSWFFSTRW